MKKVLFIFFVIIFSQDTLFSQNFVSRRNGPFQYQSLLTSEQKEEILFNVLKSKDFYIEQTDNEFYLCKNGEVYAILAKAKKYEGPSIGFRGKIVPLFEILCKEKKEELFGVSVFFKDIDLEYKQCLRMEY